MAPRPEMGPPNGLASADCRKLRAPSGCGGGGGPLARLLEPLQLAPTRRRPSNGRHQFRFWSESDWLAGRPKKSCGQYAWRD